MSGKVSMPLVLITFALSLWVMIPADSRGAAIQNSSVVAENLSSSHADFATAQDCGFYNVTEIDDPVGDAAPDDPPYYDIKKLTIRQYCQYVQFVWEANGNPYNEDYNTSVIVLDTDLDPNTGQRWGGIGGEFKIGIYHTADLIYFDEGGNVVREERGLPMVFEGNKFYINVERTKIPSDRFNIWIQSGQDYATLNNIVLQQGQGEISIVLESDEMVLPNKPPLINIPDKATPVQLKTYLVQDGVRMLLPPSEISYSVSHPVSRDPRLGEPSSIISVDPAGVARYLREGYVFVTAYSTEYKLQSDTVILATGEAYGNPQTDNVIAVFPPQYAPEGSNYSFGHMMSTYQDYTETVNVAYNVTSELYRGFKPFNGDKQIFSLLVMEGHCGGGNNPLETAPCCYMNCGNGSPHYNVVIHEMGHNFADTRAMAQLLYSNGAKIGRAGFSECVASLPVIYFASEIYNNPEQYGMSRDSYEWNNYKSFLERDIPYAQSQLENFEALIENGQTTGVFDNNGLFDGVAAFCSFFQSYSYRFTQDTNLYGNEMIRRFLNIFDDRDLPEFQEGRVETYFGAAFSVAVGQDVRDMLRFWGFNIDDEYYDWIMKKLLARNRPIYLPLILRSHSTSPPSQWALISSRPDIKRASAAMAYDSHRGVTVMFGGRSEFNSTSSLNDTWEYDGSTWTRVSTAHAPPARYWHNMAYDARRRVIVLFEGEQAGTRLGNTWEYDSTDWGRVYTTHSPSARQGFTMTYDTCRQRVVLFGGNSQAGREGDTWEYDGTDWVRVDTATSPPARTLTSMVHDPVRCRTILFGGLPAGHLNGLTDTWEYDGINWTRVDTPTSPGGRWAHTMAYDAARRRVVLFGGYGPAYPTGSQLDDTWEYDGSTWVQVFPEDSPMAREQHAMAYDSARQRVVLFGGFRDPGDIGGDTWEYAVLDSWPSWRVEVRPNAVSQHGQIK